MKITTWNVNGYRAVQKKGFKEWLEKEAPDVLCLQEIKVKEEQLAEEQKTFPGYQTIWNSAQRPGYSGTAMFIRDGLIGKTSSLELGLPDDRFDDEGRVIRFADQKTILYNIYFPNGQRGLDRLAYKLDFYASLLEKCESYHANGWKIIITGDFNTAHTPLDLKNAKANETNSGFLPEERAWIDRFLEMGFVDAFRRLYPEKVEYTWWSVVTRSREKNIGWRLDYFLVSDGLINKVRDVINHGDVQGSDHCPVSMILDEW